MRWSCSSRLLWVVNFIYSPPDREASWEALFRRREVMTNMSRGSNLNSGGCTRYIGSGGMGSLASLGEGAGEGEGWGEGAGRGEGERPGHGLNSGSGLGRP